MRDPAVLFYTGDFLNGCTDLLERLRKLAKNGNCEIEIHKTEKSVKVYSFTLLF